MGSLGRVGPPAGAGLGARSPAAARQQHLPDEPGLLRLRLLLPPAAGNSLAVERVRCSQRRAVPEHVGEGARVSRLWTTTNTAAGRSGGNPATTSPTACTPPAEAPTTRMSRAWISRAIEAHVRIAGGRRHEPRHRARRFAAAFFAWAESARLEVVPLGSRFSALPVAALRLREGDLGLRFSWPTS
jgi:hypothetical protein